MAGVIITIVLSLYIVNESTSVTSKTHADSKLIKCRRVGVDNSDKQAAAAHHHHP